MNIAIYGRRLKDNQVGFLQTILEYLGKEDGTIYLSQNYYEKIKEKVSFAENFKFFHQGEDLKGKVDFLLSVGGDGTLLDTVTITAESGIPVLGYNFGRLGFLTRVDKEEAIQSLEALKKGAYKIEDRSLLHLDSSSNLFEQSYCLNEFSIHRRNTSSMITIHSYIGDTKLNSYWADGLIVATPTGSTGYSLSCGGPIIAPDAASIVITPVAAHNLNVRPYVLPDHNELRFEVEGRSDNFLCTLDSRNALFGPEEKLSIKKESFPFKLIRLNGDDHIQALRDRLLWGADMRN